MGFGRYIYCSCVRPGAPMKDWDYALALIQLYLLFVPESSMNLAVTRASADRCDFADAERIAAFAFCNGMALRGHNLV